MFRLFTKFERMVDFTAVRPTSEPRAPIRVRAAGMYARSACVGRTETRVEAEREKMFANRGYRRVGLVSGP